MTRCTPIIAVALLALSGCAQLGGYLGAARGVTDALVARGGEIGRKAMAATDRIEAELVTELGRVRASRCYHALEVVREYALDTPERHAAILRDCHLDVQRSTDVLLPALPE